MTDWPESAWQVFVNEQYAGKFELLSEIEAENFEKPIYIQHAPNRVWACMRNNDWFNLHEDKIPPTVRAAALLLT